MNGLIIGNLHRGGRPATGNLQRDRERKRVISVREGDDPPIHGVPVELEPLATELNNSGRTHHVPNVSSKPVISSPGKKSARCGTDAVAAV